MNPLKQLESAGQSPWLDYLKRSLVESGELKTLIERDGLKGLTSNPSIFEKAIDQGDDYLGAIKDFQAKGDHGINEIYEHLAIADIQAAADVLRTVYDATKGRDGYVSLECSPYLANDTEATIAEAERLWKTVNRPNLMVKVPATNAGIPAIEKLIGQGININVTLLFAVSAYEKVAQAYIAGLETLQKSGGKLDHVASVASFFVSRIDSAVDKQLQSKGTLEAKALESKIAIANAKVAYERYKALFGDARWDKIAKVGAQTQRLLWASTSTKNPALPDTLYVDALIGPDTVDTIPPATMDAFRDHGKFSTGAIQKDLGEAKSQLAALDKLGISLNDITHKLVEDGVQQFADAFDTLLGGIARRRRTISGGGAISMEIIPGSDDMKKALSAEMDAWRKEGRIRRLWAGDAALWTGADEAKWLGWLGNVEKEQADLPALKKFAADMKAKGFSDVVLLGMGGSSLGPDVLSQSFGHQSGGPRFHMLDSTDPAQIATLEKACDLARTLVIVASKSGSTLEPNIFMEYFLDRVGAARGKDKVGEAFVAVTDPGSSLDKFAAEHKFAHVFHGVPSIGGRYSVLSKFGLVPAAAIGLDVEKLLAVTMEMVRACSSDVPPSENPGVQLGVALGVAAKQFGRDKVTIVTSPKIKALGAWLEQLIAESTGKHGKGLIPLADEPLAAEAAAYGQDRIFGYLELEGDADATQRKLMADLTKAGHPVIHVTLKDLFHIGQEFFRWEMATAIAGAIIGINPFDQPDVEASKIKTKKLTEEYEKSHHLPEEKPIFRDAGLAFYADAKNAAALGQLKSATDYLKAHFARVKGGVAHGDYVGLLAYIERDDAHEKALVAMAGLLRDKTKAAACVGFGPRFQHSTGQAYKGGPNSGVFLQITCDDPKDLKVPGHDYTFGVVKAAQARGDLDVLYERDRRALRVHLTDVDSGLKALAEALKAALA